MDVPVYCRQEAFDAFVSEVGRLETSEGLTNAVVAIAMHFDPDACTRHVNLELDDIAGVIQGRVSSGSSRAKMAHLHQVLFEELGFRGDTENYFDPRNSFLPNVLECKRGMPITLSLVYKLVAERIGLRVCGLNTPGHFLVRLKTEDEQMIVDPFFGGELLSPTEVSARILQVTGSKEMAAESDYETVTHRQWVARILANLIHIFSIESRPEEIAAVSELYDVLKVAY